MTSDSYGPMGRDIINDMVNTWGLRGPRIEGPISDIEQQKAFITYVAVPWIACRLVQQDRPDIKQCDARELLEQSFGYGMAVFEASD